MTDLEVIVEPPIASTLALLSDAEPSVTTENDATASDLAVNCDVNDGSCLALIPRPAVSLIERNDIPSTFPSVEIPTVNLISPP